MKKVRWLGLLMIMVPSITAHANSLSPVDNITPIEVQIACNKYGLEYDICPELLEAICYQESRFDEKALDGTESCYGLMQIKRSCHRERMNELGVNDLFDIDSNIHLATDYIAELFDEYEDAATVLMVYHGESNAVSRAEKGQLSKYAEEILERSASLERLHGK